MLRNYRRMSLMGGLLVGVIGLIAYLANSHGKITVVAAIILVVYTVAANSSANIIMMKNVRKNSPYRPLSDEERQAQL